MVLAAATRVNGLNFILRIIRPKIRPLSGGRIVMFLHSRWCRPQQLSLTPQALVLLSVVQGGSDSCQRTASAIVTRTVAA